MRRRNHARGTLGSLALAFGLVGVSVAGVAGVGRFAKGVLTDLDVPLPPLNAPALAVAAEATRVNLALIELGSTGYVARTADGQLAELTLDPALQAATERIIDQPGVEQASAVVVSIEDGRVLALAGRSETRPHAPELATIPWAPAASIFKVITAATLVESGAPIDERVCYHGGVHSVEADNLQARPRQDSSCGTLAYGLAKSQNAILARLADRHLMPAMLTDMAERFGWNRTLPFDAEMLPSSASIPVERLPFARTAAGFWSTTLSPLHGALIAATIARGGTMPGVHLIDRIQGQGADGESITPKRPDPVRVLDAEAARRVGEMMLGTTQFGTAKRGFLDERGHPRLPGVRVAGKTGTLSRPSPYRGYSWFIGYAPVDKPEVAVAVLLGNGPHSNLRAHQLAARLLDRYFAGTPSATVATR